MLTQAPGPTVISLLCFQLKILERPTCPTSLYPFDTVFRFNFATSGTSARERRDSGTGGERLGRSLLAAPTNGRVSLRFGLVTPDPRLRGSSVLSSSLPPSSALPLPCDFRQRNQSVSGYAVSPSLYRLTSPNMKTSMTDPARQNLSQTAKTSSRMSSLNRG